jgi:Mg-chelatase subunit ChlD
MRFSISAIVAIFGVSMFASCQGPGSVSSRAPDVNPLEEMLRSHADVARQDGIAAAVLMDTSGSMSGSVMDIDGQSKPKIEIARRAAIDCVRQFEEYTRKNPDRKVLVGIYEFSARDKGQSCRQVVRLGPPDSAAAAPAINAMVPSGGTPIGNAMIQAKLDLDLTGMSRRHILVITDGQNNRGYSPGDVANALSRIPEGERASLYFIAFDTGADQFTAVKDAGGLVLAASSGGDLKQTLDFVLTGKILVEQPVAPASR